MRAAPAIGIPISWLRIIVISRIVVLFHKITIRVKRKEHDENKRRTEHLQRGVEVVNEELNELNEDELSLVTGGKKTIHIDTGKANQSMKADKLVIFSERN